MPNDKKNQLHINIKPEIFMASATLITPGPKGIEIVMVSGNSGQRYFFDWEHATKFFASLESHIQKLRKVPTQNNPIA